MGSVTIRVRSLVWFATGAMLAVAVTIMFVTAWRADAAPGPGESAIVSVNPARLLDSRDPVDLGLAGPFASRVPEKLQITGSVPTATGVQTVVPVGATGVLLNVTALNATADGFVSIRPGDATGPPTTSSLNFTAGQIVPNSVQVALATSGANAGQLDITFDAFGQTGPTMDLLIDVVGYTTNVGIQSIVTDLTKKADNTDVYTKTDVDTALAGKADTTDTYTKSEVDASLGAKANSADVYTKSETYSRSEVDALGPEAYGEVIGTTGVQVSNRPSLGSAFPAKYTTDSAVGVYRLNFPNFVSSPLSCFSVTRPLIIATVVSGGAGTTIRTSNFGCQGTTLFYTFEVTDKDQNLVDANWNYLVFLP